MICFTRRYKEKKERKEKGKRIDGIVSIKSIRASHELHTIRPLLFCIHRIFRTESFENDNKDVGPFDFVNMTTIERVQSRQFRRGKKTYSNFLSVTAKRNQLFAKSLPKTRETECKNIDPSTIFVSKQEFVRKIRCPVTRLSATRWWTNEEKAFLFITRVLLLIYLFISYSNDRSISSNFFPFTHSFSTEYESSSKKSSSAVFLHLLIRNLEIYKKKLYH